MEVLIWIQILNHNFSHSARVSERFFKKFILDKRGSDQTVPVYYSSFVTDSMHFNCTLQCQPWQSFNYSFLRVNSKGAEQSVWMCRQVCVFVVRMQLSQDFLGTWPKLIV